MSKNYLITDEMMDKVLTFYKTGNSSYEIKEKLNLDVTPRTIQRWVKDAGISRSSGDAFRLAVFKGRVKFHLKEVKKHRTKLSPKLRYEILKRDGFRCCDCGRSPPDCVLEVHHINEVTDDNNKDNLKTLCHECNRGNYLAK